MTGMQFIFGVVMFGVGYMTIYPLVDRVCKCIEHCADKNCEAAGKEGKEDA